MSLLDAFLLEPAPLNIWLAVREDSNRGCGTASDPYSAGPKYGAPSVATLSRANGSTTATAVVPAGHGLQNGDLVRIRGAAGPYGTLWNGTFSILNVNPGSFQYVMAGVPAVSPATGTIAAEKITGTWFDDVMNALPSNAPVHVYLGSGTFYTRGYSDGVAGGWQPRPGMRILGSGVGVTRLKLLWATSAHQQYFAIGHSLGVGSNPVQPNRMDAFEVSDLTIDCNLAGNGTVGCGAVRIMGHHSRIRRVKVINWGTKTTAKPCYVLSLITADPTSNAIELVNPRIEDCIVVEPGPSVAGCRVTLLHAGGKDDTATDVEAYGSVPQIRNCFADGLPFSGPADLTLDYRGVAMAWCRGGVIEGNQIHNLRTGGPYLRDATVRDLIVRNNTYRNVVLGLRWDMGTVFPAVPTALSSLIPDPGDASGVTALATTSVAHSYQTGDRVFISTGAAASPYAGVFVIKDAPVPTQFRYVMASVPGGAAVTPKHQRVYGAGTLVFEGNAVGLSPAVSGLAIQIYDQKIMEDVPTDVVGTAILRNNKIRYVDAIFEPTNLGSAMMVNGVTHAVVTDNVIETAPSDPIKIYRCRNVTVDNNRMPSGVLIEAYNTDANRRYAELETDNDFALVMSLFAHRVR